MLSKILLGLTIVSGLSVACSDPAQNQSSLSEKTAHSKALVLATIEEKDIVIATGIHNADIAQISVPKFGLSGECSKSKGLWNCKTPNKVAFKVAVAGTSIEGGGSFYSLRLLLVKNAFQLAKAIESPAWYFSSLKVQKIAGACDQNDETDFTCVLEGTKIPFDVILGK